MPEFYDYQALFHRALEGGEVELYLFGAGDSMAFDIGERDARSDPQIAGLFESSATYLTLGANWRQRWSDRLDQDIVLAYTTNESEFQIGTDEVGEPFYLKSRFDNYHLQPEWRWNFDEGNRLFVGLAIDYYDVPLDFYMSRFMNEGEADYDFTTQEKYRFKDTLHIQAYGPYIKHRVEWTERLATILGLRYSDISVSGGYHSGDFSPRGAVEYRLTKDTLLAASLGRYVQVPSVDTIIEDVGNPGLAVTEALHGVLGLEQQITPRYSVKVEGYYKEMRDLVVVDDSRDPPENYSNRGEGEAWGVDFFFKRKAEGRRFGWLGFSYGKSTRTNNLSGETRDFSGDQPWALKAVWGAPFPGSWKKWQWSTKFQIHSGSPYTAVTGRHREDPGGPREPLGPGVRGAQRRAHAALLQA